MVLLAEEKLTPTRLKRIRRSILDLEGRPLTHQAFAEIIGVGVSTVSRWENGHFSPSKPCRDRIRELESLYSGKRVKVTTTAEHVAVVEPVE